MSTTDGLTRVYIDSNAVSILLITAGTEVLAVMVEFDVVGVDVDVIAVHPVKMITSVKSTEITHNFLFITIAP